MFLSSSLWWPGYYRFIFFGVVPTSYPQENLRNWVRRSELSPRNSDRFFGNSERVLPNDDQAAWLWSTSLRDSELNVGMLSEGTELIRYPIQGQNIRQVGEHQAGFYASGNHPTSQLSVLRNELEYQLASSHVLLTSEP